MASEWGKSVGRPEQGLNAEAQVDDPKARDGSENWLSGLVTKSGEGSAPEKDGARVQDSTGNWLSGLVSQPNLDKTAGEEPAPQAKPAPRAESAPAPTPQAKPTPQPKLERPVPPISAPPKSKLAPLERPATSSPNQPKKRPEPSSVQKTPALRPRVSSRELVTFYRSLSVMLSSGVPLFACFEFLSRDGESEPLCKACRRIGQRLVEGFPLHKAVTPEQPYFDQKAIKLIEVGYKSGSLNNILASLARDTEENWKLESQIKSGLIYPLGIAAVATVGVVFLPPLVLNDLLNQIVQLTAEPPPITKAILGFSAFLSSPWVIGTTILLIIGVGILIRTPFWHQSKSKLERYLWDIPAVGNLWANVVSVRFLSVFALTYECGLPATQCLLLSASATGSRYAEQRGGEMKDILVAGGTLRETFEAGGFLSPLALEAVESGQQTGKVPDLLTRCAEILKTEIQSRIEAVAKLVEPLVLIVLGTFVGVFALGCLLPIIKLVETL